jgi:hypothetical protein
VGTIFSSPFQMGTGTQTSLLHNGYRVFPGVKCPQRDVNHTPHLAPRLNSRAIFLHPFWIFVAFLRVKYLCVYVLTENVVTVSVKADGANYQNRLHA